MLLLKNPAFYEKKSLKEFKELEKSNKTNDNMSACIFLPPKKH